MLWAADVMARPTFRNLNDGFESWASRNGYLREIERLQARRYIEQNVGTTDQRLQRLSELGRARVLGGRDPEVQWARPWDGVWRMVMFDVPVRERELRDRVRYYLQTRFFGCLQQSVWVAPEMRKEDVEKLGREIDPKALIFINGQPFAGEQDRQIVTAAWDFERINSDYARFLGFLETIPRSTRNKNADLACLQGWAATEHKAWVTAIAHDPMLPAVLLPKNYLGRKAWERRKEVSHALTLRMLA
jgi:phenylacetic acid degradation operon negative regulatory protein